MRSMACPGVRRASTMLHELLEAQVYRLSHWRTASHEINYRRFFDVNGLAGLRVEDPQVFAATHELLGKLIASGQRAGGPHRSPGWAVRSGEVLRHAAAARRRRSLRRRREDPVEPRTPARALGRRRHDRLQLPQRPQRDLHQSRRGQADAARLREAHRPDRLVRRGQVRQQASHHGDRHGERAERPGTRPQPDRRRQPALA